MVATALLSLLIYSVASVVLKESSTPDSTAIENDLLPRDADRRWERKLRGGDDILNILTETEDIWLRPNLVHRDALILEVRLFHAYFEHL